MDLHTSEPPPAPPPAGEPPLAPGAYLRLRRQAAGLSHKDVGLIVGGAEGAAEAARRLEALERGDNLVTIGFRSPVEVMDFVALVHGAFRFDDAIWLALVGIANDPESGLPQPDICRSCGCSWHDACIDGGSPCSWANPQATLCSRCARPAVSADQEAARHDA